MRGNSGSEQGNMDYYYRKLMGHGAVASKFRLNLTPSVKLNQSNLRQAKEVTATADSENVGTTGSKSEGATQSSASPVAAVAVSSAGSLEGSAPVGSEPPCRPLRRPQLVT